jgi:dihydrofolate reductase
VNAVSSLPVTSAQTLALIASVARNGCIGSDNGLVWHEPIDQRHFRTTTWGHPVVMGRKTWQSLPERFRPLPGRRNVVVTRNAQFAAPGAECAGSLSDALALLAGCAKVFVIGGAPLFAQALPLADELVLTEIDADLPGDTFFPSWPREQFEEQSRQTAVSSQSLTFAIVHYRRKTAANQ